MRASGPAAVARSRALAVARRWLPALLLLVIVGPTLGAGSLWIDEVHSLVVARDLGSIARALRHEEANMGLYYLGLRAWRLAGDGDAWVRALSLLAALLCVPAMRRVGGVGACVLLVLHGTFLGFSREVRGYAWMLALVLLATAALLGATRRGSTRGLIAWAIWAALAVHAHALAVVVVAAHVVVLGARLPQFGARRVGLAIGLWASLTLPLLALQPAGDAQLGWIVRRGGLDTLDALGRSAGGGHLAGALVWSVAAVGASAVVLLRLRGAQRVQWLALAWVPPLSLLVIDRAIQPLYLERYGVVVVPGVAALIAVGARLLIGRRLVRAVVLLAIASTALVGYDARPKEDWRGVAEYLRAQAKPGDAVVVYAYFCRPALERYLAGASVEVVEVASGPYAAAGGERLPEPDLARLDRVARARGRVWLVSSHHHFPRLGRDQQHRAIEGALERALGKGPARGFDGVRLRLFAPSR